MRSGSGSGDSAGPRARASRPAGARRGCGTPAPTGSGHRRGRRGTRAGCCGGPAGRGRRRKAEANGPPASLSPSSAGRPSAASQTATPGHRAMFFIIRAPRRRVVADRDHRPAASPRRGVEQAEDRARVRPGQRVEGVAERPARRVEEGPAGVDRQEELARAAVGPTAPGQGDRLPGEIDQGQVARPDALAQPFPDRPVQVLAGRPEVSDGLDAPGRGRRARIGHQQDVVVAPSGLPGDPVADRHGVPHGPPTVPDRRVLVAIDAHDDGPDLRPPGAVPDGPSRGRGRRRLSRRPEGPGSRLLARPAADEPEGETGRRHQADRRAGPVHECSLPGGRDLLEPVIVQAVRGPRSPARGMWGGRLLLDRRRHAKPQVVVRGTGLEARPGRRVRPLVEWSIERASPDRVLGRIRIRDGRPFRVVDRHGGVSRPGSKHHSRTLPARSKNPCSVLSSGHRRMGFVPSDPRFAFRSGAPSQNVSALSPQT